eukprot:2534524-Rhodomonas_salina.2
MSSITHNTFLLRADTRSRLRARRWRWAAAARLPPPALTRPRSMKPPRRATPALSPTRQTAPPTRPEHRARGGRIGRQAPGPAAAPKESARRQRPQRPSSPPPPAPEMRAPQCCLRELF